MAKNVSNSDIVRQPLNENDSQQYPQEDDGYPD